MHMSVYLSSLLWLYYSKMKLVLCKLRASLVAQTVKNLNAEAQGSTVGSGSSPGEGDGNSSILA